MKTLLWLALAASMPVLARGQIYTTSTGEISFHSHTFLEDIDAVNQHVYAAIDPGKKNMAFILRMKGFNFKRKLMQEHFNENYVESDKYPNASFEGTFTGELDKSKEGSYPVTVKGKMTIHGVTRDVEAPGTMVIKDGNILGTATFKLNPADYKIDIPALVREKIEKENTVNVKIECKPKS